MTEQTIRTGDRHLLIDRGRPLENAVFLHHRRQREDLVYLGGPAEIDLVVGSERAEAWVNTAWSFLKKRPGNGK